MGINKNILVISLTYILGVGIACGQGMFTIQGHLENTNKKQAYLIYFNNGHERVDSVSIEKGQFVFKGIIKEPSRATVFIGEKPNPQKKVRLDYCSFFLQQGTTRIHAKDSIRDAHAEGTEIIEDEKRLNRRLKAVQDKLRLIQMEYDSLTEGEKQDATITMEIEERFHRTEDLLTPLYLEFAKAYPSSFLSIAAISESIKKQEALPASQEAFSLLDSTLKHSDAGKRLQEIFNKYLHHKDQ